MKPLWKCALLVAALCLPAAAEAHRTWLLPSATVLSGEDPWITVDAAVSNDLFYFEHRPLQLDNLVIYAPDGTQAPPENASTGHFRSSFDLHLTQPGTYKLVLLNQGLTASYSLNGETRRWRGPAEELATAIPAEAQELKVTQVQGRVETFVTAGKPDERVLQPSGSGLELLPVTHPNDLFAGETARFRFLLDGQPAAGLEVTVIPGGIRYRDRLDEVTLTTDAEGLVAVTWPAPGLYWIAATVRDAKPSAAAAQERRASYAATLEVLAP